MLTFLPLSVCRALSTVLASLTQPAVAVISLRVEGSLETGPFACTAAQGMLTSHPHSQYGSLPQGSPLRPGHSFLRDGTSLGMLRELMVVIRIWGLLKPSCLPVYTATSDTQDSMSLLFRLLTKLWICCEAL